MALLFFGSSMTYVHAASAEISSPFGWRVHPLTGEYKFHTGTDIAYEEGTPINACMPGTVVYAAPYEGYGNTVIINHADNLTTLYAHCQRLCVSYGQSVAADTVIALSGSTGFVTGAHLHFEVWKDGQYADPSGLLEYLN